MEFTFKRLIFLFVGWSLQIYLAQEAAAQNNKPSLFSQAEFLTGYGYGIDTINLPEGNYRVFYLAAHFGIELMKRHPEKRLIPGYSIIYFEPQFNPVIVHAPTGNLHHFETGLNIGLQHVFPVVRELIDTYILIATGPHYFNAQTQRQAKGFLFSDNLGAGVFLHVNKTNAVDLAFRLRHMSNGDTRSPNQGINTFNFMIGWSHSLR